MASRSLLFINRSLLLPERLCNPPLLKGAVALSGSAARTMLLRPNRTKYRKSHKNIRAVLPAIPTGPLLAPKLKYGNYGLYAAESLRIRASQLEAARLAIVKSIGRKGTKVWIRTFPHIPVTKKALGVRMGKGKGAVDHFISNVRAGRMVYEFNSLTENAARIAHKQVNYKLPIPVKLIIKKQE